MSLPIIIAIAVAALVAIGLATRRTGPRVTTIETRHDERDATIETRRDDRGDQGE